LSILQHVSAHHMCHHQEVFEFVIMTLTCRRGQEGWLDYAVEQTVTAWGKNAENLVCIINVGNVI